MSTQAVFTGDTVTFQGIFKNPDGNLLDPDGQVGTFTVYRDDTGRQIFQASLTRQSIGSYSYDWLIPLEETIYIIELEGNFNSKPQLKRMKVRAKFRP